MRALPVLLLALAPAAAAASRTTQASGERNHSIAFESQKNTGAS